MEAGVQDKVRIVHGDIFQTDFSQATVLTLYLYHRLPIERKAEA